MSFRFYWLALVCALCLVSPSSQSQVIVNEVVADNLASYADQDRQYPDWIELYNAGTSSVNLENWSLTNDRDIPVMWRFPRHVLGPKSYLIVFASGKNRAVATKELHTSFKLSDDGVYVGLTRPDKQVVSEITLGPSRPDVSYGVNNVGNLAYFKPPSPGAANGPGFPGYVADVQFSHPRGFYDKPFQLRLHCASEGAQIYFTTNGSIPSPTNGVQYAGAPLQVNGTLLLRAISVKPGWGTPEPVAHSYFFVQEVLKQNGLLRLPTWGVAAADWEMDPDVVNHPDYASRIGRDLQTLPVISVLMHEEDIFGPTNGIYANPRNEGPEWERPMSVEIFFPDGVRTTQLNAGIKIQGGASRLEAGTPKHGLRMLFKNRYGPSKLDFPLFDTTPVQKFDTISLRMSFYDSWTAGSAWVTANPQATYVRDSFMRQTQLEMGHASGHGRYAHLYLNGMYWGIYNPVEKPNAAFAASYFGGGDPDDWDAMMTFEAVNGTTAAWDSAINKANADLTIRANYEELLKVVDITNLTDYMIVNHYGGNTDWPQNNWAAARKRKEGSQWKFFIWDAETVLFNNTENRTLAEHTNSPAQFYHRLRLNPEYRLFYGDRIHKHFFNNGALTTNAVKARFNRLTAEVESALVAESARWGDAQRANQPYLRNVEWPIETNRLTREFLIPRTSTMINQYKAPAVMLYPSVTAPGFNQHGGPISRSFNLIMTNGLAGSSIYYTTNGVDPRVMWENTPSPQALKYSSPIRLRQSAVVKARTLSGTSWSALNEAAFFVNELKAPVQITEIMYHPVGGDAYEFIELQNTGTAPVNLGLWRLEGVSYLFPPETMLAPGGILLLGSDINPAGMVNRYGAASFFGFFSGSLSDGGESLILRDHTGQVRSQVDYSDEGAWPTQADGLGPSLEIIDAKGPSNDPANWRASSAATGSPGVVHPAPTTVTGVSLSEVLADGDPSDWVEIFNAGPAAVNLSGWSLSRGEDPREYVLPPTVLAAGGYLVITCAPVPSNGAALHSGFGLPREGGMVALYNALGQRVDALSYGQQLFNQSVSRVAGRWGLSLLTPGKANAAQSVALPSSLALNEWLVQSGPGVDDFVELYNRDPLKPVALQGVHLSTVDRSFQLPWLSFIAPNGFIELKADEGAGVHHLPFKLPGGTGKLILHDDQANLLSQVNYTAVPAGASQGRLPDGGTRLEALPIPSPGASNYLLTGQEGPVINEVLARNATVVHEGLNSDWIEIHNPGTAAVDLSGMSLEVDGVRWFFPSMSLPAKGYLVVHATENREASSTASFCNVGQNLSGEGGALFLCNAAGQILQPLRYGAQVTDRSIGVVGGQWKLLAQPTPGAANGSAATLGAVTSLKINEWHPGQDYIELHNLAEQPVELSGLFLTDDPSLAGQKKFGFAPLSFIGPKGFALVDELSPSSQGGGLRLYGPTLATLDAIDFGAGSDAQGRLPDGAATLSSFPQSASPGQSNYRWLQNVVISEALSAGQPQSIEIQNVGATSLDLSGWFLSADTANLKRFKLPAGSTVAAGAYQTWTSAQWGDWKLDEVFGSTIYLSRADAAGQLTGERVQMSVPPGESGFSHGRHTNSLGAVHEVTLTRPTWGERNALPRVGPVVLAQVHYHPLDGQWEYVALKNIGTETVSLRGWRLDNAVEFEFGEVSLPGGGNVVVVGFDPAQAGALDAFRADYGMGPGVRVVGPWRGDLSNAGEELNLVRPGLAQASQYRPMHLVERVGYDDKSPWPKSADGEGQALSRKGSHEYANDPLSWEGAPPRPGGEGSRDSDGDGMPDDYEVTHGLKVTVRDAHEDADGDGQSNGDEWKSGTSASDPGSVFRIVGVEKSGGGSVVKFFGVSGRSYQVLSREGMEGTGTGAGALWQEVGRLTAPMTGVHSVPDGRPASGRRFYRVKTE